MFIRDRLKQVSVVPPGIWLRRGLTPDCPFIPFQSRGTNMSRRIALLLIAVLTLVAPAWAQPAAAPATDNPLLKEWTTPFQVPPFQEIKPEHFLPAFKEAIAQN